MTNIIDAPFFPEWSDGLFGNACLFKKCYQRFCVTFTHVELRRRTFGVFHAIRRFWLQPKLSNPEPHHSADLHRDGFKKLLSYQNISNVYSLTTRFHKIVIQCKGPVGKWTRKPLAYRESQMFSTMFSTMCNPPSWDMCHFLNILTLLANFFHSFIVFC